MLLPSNLNVIDHPPMDKMDIAALATLLLCWMKGTPGSSPTRSVVAYVFAIAFVVSPILTSFENSYELQTAGKSVPGFYPIDGLKFAARNILVLIPFYIGSRFLSSDSARLELIKALPTALLVYSIPMLLEVRISPQIHHWVYGYLPSLFSQQVRSDGFRPVVFFPHGLTLALFTALAMLAAVVMIRARKKISNFPPAPVASYLAVILVLCKSLGPIVYAVTLAPVVLLTRPRFWVKIGCGASLFVCAYPLLRSHGLAPDAFVSEIASSLSAERNASFQTRVGNEEELLAKANQKPLLGWGGWSRNRIFDQWSGKDISITDGGWIIAFGTFGWFGYLAFYGLLAFAQFSAVRAVGNELNVENIARGGLALLLAVYVIDQIPNSGEMSLILLLGGAISSSAGVARRPARASTKPNIRSSRANTIPRSA